MKIPPLVCVYIFFYRVADDKLCSDTGFQGTGPAVVVLLFADEIDDGINGSGTKCTFWNIDGGQRRPGQRCVWSVIKTNQGNVFRDFVTKHMKRS